jgi:hypothetical protein
MKNCSAHHWLIETPNGAPIIKGVCKHCGGKKQFSVNGNADWETPRLVRRDEVKVLSSWRTR